MSFLKNTRTGWLAALMLLCAWSVRAEMVIPGITFEPQSGIDMRITSAYKQFPSAGFIPLQIYIHNTSGQTRSWNFHFTGSNYPDTYELPRTFTVPDKTEQTFEVMVPVPANINRSYGSSGNLQINVTGYGISQGFAGKSVGSSSGNTPTTFALISPALALHSMGPLEKACSDKGYEFYGSEFNPSFLPADWRGYLGVGTLWITDAEWQALDAGPRGAIREWVFQGGDLVIFLNSSQATPSDFGFRNGEAGYGQVRVSTWDGRELNPGNVVPALLREFPLAKQLADGYETRWELLGTIGGMQFSGLFILGFVICFGFVIGPVNLFWFAKSSQRHRLFWTTPLISLAGSILLAAVIILQDGFGGAGNRISLVQLLPGENEAIIVQEQVSRTGLLLSTGFDPEEKIYMSPIKNLPHFSSDYRGVSRTLNVKREQGRYNMQEHAYSGDWFASRSVQAQLIEVIRPTRARIEIIAGGGGTPPSLLSSVENDLQQVFYIDNDGRYWQAGPTHVGERKVLQSSNEQDFDNWMKPNINTAGGRVAYLYDRAKKRRGYFYAVAEAPKNDAVATMSSIRWNTPVTIYLGPCATEKEVAK